MVSTSSCVRADAALFLARGASRSLNIRDRVNFFDLPLPAGLHGDYATCGGSVFGRKVVLESV